LLKVLFFIEMCKGIWDFLGVGFDDGGGTGGAFWLGFVSEE
jgi:hypothetical protein